MKNKIHNYARTALIAVTALVYNTSKGAVVYNSNTLAGNWSAGTTWTQTGSSGTVKYVIDAGDNITVNGNFSGIDTIEIYGTLTFPTGNRSLTLNTGGIIIVHTGGVLTGGTANSEIIFTGTAQHVIGPFLGTGNGIEGPVYANGATAAVSAGKPSVAFVSTSLLPVVLSSVEVVKVGVNYELKWTALGESNQGTFTIEVSENGRDFTFAGTVAGNNEISTGDYNFAIIGMKNDFYVRLSETDKNGTSTLLVTKYVKNNTTADAFQLYPNLIAPAGQEINMVLPVSGNYKVVVYTMNMTVAAETATTTYSNNEAVALNSSDWNLNAGNYVVVVSGDNGQVHKTRIVVQ